MQQWEYLDLWIWGDKWADSRGGSGQFDSQEHIRWGKWYPPTSRTNELGAEGWELASVAPSEQGSYIVMFKRAKE